MNHIIIYACLGVMLLCSVLAVMLRSIIKNAICLAAASAALGLIMYVMGAPAAAVFEVSVCSGLITVIFISGISLSRAGKNDVREEFSDGKRMHLLPVILLVAGALMMVAACGIHFAIARGEALNLDYREVFWNQRGADIWGQIIVMLTGGIAISVLLKERKVKHK